MGAVVVVLVSACGRALPVVDDPRNPASPIYREAVLIRETRSIECCYPSEGQPECSAWDTTYGTSDAVEEVAQFYQGIGFQGKGASDERQGLQRWVGVREGDRVSWRKVDIATGEVAGVHKWTTAFSVLAPNCAKRVEETTTPEPALVAESVCLAENLRVVPRWGVAAGSYGGSWQFVNVGSSPCFLLGRPQAALIDAKGRVLLRSMPAPAHPQVYLRPGEAAEAIVLWSNWCQRDQGSFRIRILFSGNGGVLTTAVPGVAGCIGPREAGSRLTIEGFFPAAD